MVYKLNYVWCYSCLLLISGAFFSACNSSKQPAEIKYYIEFLNGKDSVKTGLGYRLYGKLSFYKNGELNIVSTNYKTGDFPDTHLFLPLAELPKEVEKGTHKLSIEFAGNYTIDSSYYAIRQFDYERKAWVKVSDMGFIKLPQRYGDEKSSDTMTLRQWLSVVPKAIVNFTYLREQK